MNCPDTDVKKTEMTKFRLGGLFNNSKELGLSVGRDNTSCFTIQ